MFRLLGGVVAVDLAVLPSATHVTLMERVDWLISMRWRIPWRAHAGGHAGMMY
jgi:hypothetical protein